VANHTLHYHTPHWEEPPPSGHNSRYSEPGRLRIRTRISYSRGIFAIRSRRSGKVALPYDFYAFPGTATLPSARHQDGDAVAPFSFPLTCCVCIHADTQEHIPGVAKPKGANWGPILSSRNVVKYPNGNSRSPSAAGDVYQEGWLNALLSKHHHPTNPRGCSFILPIA
jgi:hypothetical protein